MWSTMNDTCGIRAPLQGLYWGVFISQGVVKATLFLALGYASTPRWGLFRGTLVPRAFVKSKAFPLPWAVLERPFGAFSFREFRLSP